MRGFGTVLSSAHRVTGERYENTHATRRPGRSRLVTRRGPRAGSRPSATSSADGCAGGASAGSGPTRRVIVESGLTRDQISEALIHLGFYAGWSNATNAMTAV